MQRAAEHGIAVQQLRRKCLGSSARAGLVLGYGAIATDAIERGLALLRRCCD